MTFSVQLTRSGPFSLVTTVIGDAAVGATPFGPNLSVGRQRLPTEPLGNLSLSFSGVKEGSEIHIFATGGVEIAGTESVVGTPTFSVPYYAAGNPSNNVRVLVASLAYENVDISYTLTSKDATIPIFQRIDRNYRNPA